MEDFVFWLSLPGHNPSQKETRARAEEEAREAHCLLACLLAIFLSRAKMSFSHSPDPLA